MDGDSCSREQLAELCGRMVEYYAGDAKRIQHLIKVHSFSKMIAEKEELDETTSFILEAAAYTHDIGIRPAEEKYGRCDGHLQEQEGPTVAQKMLSEVGIENYMIERICYLIGHHHTYDQVEGMDYQILIEADFLVNMLEEDMGRRAVEKAYRKIFRTESGRRLCRIMYGIDEEREEDRF